MKTSVVIFISIFLLGYTAQAQVYFIPKAGITFSTIAFDEEKKEQKLKMGVVAGFGLNLPLVKDFLSIHQNCCIYKKDISQNLTSGLLALLILYWKQMRTLIDISSKTDLD